jgi:hypothetical protein
MTGGLHARLSLAMFVVALISARAARAYVHYEAVPGHPVAWGQTCVPIVVYPDDLAGNGIDADGIVAAASAAAAAWSTPAVRDTFLSIQVSASPGPGPDAVDDRQNTLTFQSRWCSPAGEDCTYSPDATAITTLFVGTSTGRILDADIQVNAEYFAWTDRVADPDTPVSGTLDLQNTLTHEIGHLIGLDHPCTTPDSPGTGQRDHLGNPLPRCADAVDAIHEATMFPTTIAGDTSKRTLSTDDEQAVRDIYPATLDPMLCAGSGSPLRPGDTPFGCQVAAAPMAPGAVALLLGAAAIAASLARPQRTRRS